MLGAKIGEPACQAGALAKADASRRSRLQGGAKDTFNADNNVLYEGENQFKEQFGVGFDVFMDLDLPFMADNADIHFSGMQIDLSGRSLGEA